MIDPLSDEKVADSWRKNAAPWTTAVRDGQIASRVLVTNRAIVDAILSRKPATMLDIGCGEGWLMRELATHGVKAIGVDVVPDLIERARQAGGGEVRIASHEDVAAGKLDVSVDVAVANFSLIGKESVDNLIRRGPALLTRGGAFIVQTMHPVIAGGDEPYVDGWRPGSWAGFSSDFTDPAPWYFRTLESWVNLFTSSGLELVEMREPLHPETGKPASVIFIALSSGPVSDR